LASANRRLLQWLLPLALVTLLIALYPVWLAGLGGFLVKADAPAQAGIVVVLAGDQRGNRILKAGDLVRQGYVPKVLVSGPPYYGAHESDAAIPFAVRHGCPLDWFEAFPIKGLSTREEALEILPELRRRGIRKVIIVTSDYHTRRAGFIYRSLASDLDVRVVAASDTYFRAGGWWRHRQGCKAFFFEWVKLAASLVGM